MSWWLALLALVSGWLTWNVYRPAYAPGRRAAVSFFLGWLVGELALHHVAAQAVLAFALVWNGALERGVGVLAGFGLLAAWVLLVRAYFKGEQAAWVMEQALREELGPDYRERVPPEIREKWVERPDWKKIAFPFPIRDPNVERIADVLYRRVAGVNLRLDIYRHRDRPKNCPLLIQIHGGGWVIGSKNEQGLPLTYHMASRGWVCANVDYRLSPHATFPDHLVDLKAALVWLREHASQYGLDPTFVVVTGGSAGAHLAALMALTANDPEYQPGFEAADTSVQGAVLMYGVYDLVDRHRTFRTPDIQRLLETKVMKASIEEARALYEKASPISRVHSGAPPVCVIHGDLDSLVPVEQARYFVAALRGVSKQPVVYAEIPGAQHAFDVFPSLRCEYAIAGIARFLGWTYAQYLRQRSAG